MIIRHSRIPTVSFEVCVDGNHVFYAETKDFAAKEAVLFVTQQHSHELSQDKSVVKSRLCRSNARRKAQQRLRFSHKVNSQGSVTSVSLCCGKRLTFTVLWHQDCSYFSLSPEIKRTNSSLQ